MRTLYLLIICLFTFSAKLTADGFEDPNAKNTEKELEKVSKEAKIKLDALDKKANSKKAPKKSTVKKSKYSFNCRDLNEKEKEKYLDNRHLIKGELAQIGSVGLTPFDNRFGITIGAEQIHRQVFATAQPELYLSGCLAEKKISSNIIIPLRFELFDQRLGTDKFKNIGTLRSEDWDNPKDYSQILRYLTYGRKEDRFYFDINAYRSNSIGHGTIMKRYNPNLNINEKKVPVAMDAYNEYGGFETYMNHLAGPTLFSGIVFLKPFGLLNTNNLQLKTTSVGLTAVLDKDTPLRHQIDSIDLDKDGRRKEISIDPDNLEPVMFSKDVLAYGIDIETKVYLDSNLDVKVYGDLSFLKGYVPDDGDKSGNTRSKTNIDLKGQDIKDVTSKGYALGALLRSNFKTDVGDIYANRARVEFRLHDANYIPSYFNTFYEIQKLQYYSQKSLERIYPNKDGQESINTVNNTKMQEVLIREGDMVFSYYFENTFALPNNYAIALGFEGSSRYDNSSFLFHVEKYWGAFQLATTYMKRNLSSFSDIWSFENSNTFFIFTSRFEMFSWWHFKLDTITPYTLSAEGDKFFSNVIDVHFSTQLGFDF